MIRGRRLGDRREAAVRPVERARVDDRAGDRRPVPRDELGGGVNDEVCPPLDRQAHIRRSERVVDYERRPDFVRDGRGELDVEHVAARVRDRLGEEGLRVGRDATPPAVGIVHVDPVQRDLELAREVVQLRRRAAVQRLRHGDPVARLEQREEEGGLRGEPAGERHGAGTAFEVREALLERRDGRIHDPAVDVAVLLQVEIRRRRLRVLEDERRGLVDRRRARPGVRDQAAARSARRGC